MTKGRALTLRQAAFVREYLVDLNLTKAATRAGYSPKTAEQQGYQLIQKTSIKAQIQAAMDKRAEVVGLTAADVLRDINLVKADAMKQVADKEGITAMANHAAALKALELQGKHLKMFTDKTEVSGVNGGPIDSKLTIEYVRPNSAS